MTMVERVGRAMETAHECSQCGHLVAWADVVFTCCCTRQSWVAASPENRARAAIQAMKEPSEAMENAGVDTFMQNGFDMDEGELKRGYRAMIDAALSEEG